MTTNYTNLDALILSRLRGHASTFSGLLNGAIASECTRLGKVSGRDTFRVLEGRLQALRRQGHIEFNTSDGWALRSAA